MTKRAENIIEQADLKEVPSEDSPVVDGVVFDPVPAVDTIQQLNLTSSQSYRVNRNGERASSQYLKEHWGLMV